MDIAILFSGEGSNMLALCANEKHYHVTGVIAENRETANAVSSKLNKEYNHIHMFIAEDEGKYSEDNLDYVLRTMVGDVDLICLAGFMPILSKKFIDKWKGKIVNIHPSHNLKYKGLNTHERVLQAGESLHGSAVHWVTDKVDDGEIIQFMGLHVNENDTPASLMDRVKDLEHILYPSTVNALAVRHRVDNLFMARKYKL